MTSEQPTERARGLIFSPWNLLLIIPFVLLLLTPIYNRKSPEMFGMPFFYWFQFAVIVLGVLCTVTVYRMTRNKPVRRAPGATPDVDELDEGRAE